jgi:hypothetical protein
MLSKEEKSALNHLFWSDFRKVMRSTTSSSNKRINWLNYPTNLKHTFVRLVFNPRETSLCYDVQFRDNDIRTLFWEQLQELKTIIESSMGSPTVWVKDYETSEGLSISRLKWETTEYSLHNEKDWKPAHLFLKERLLEFDIFYQEYKDILIHLIK